MSDNQEKYTSGYEPANDARQYPGYTAYNHNNSAPQAYTWNSQTGEYGYSSGNNRGIPPKKKKDGAPFGIKLLAVLLCCAVTSAATLGVFVWMLKYGYVEVNTGGVQTEYVPEEEFAEETETSLPETQPDEEESGVFEIEEPVKGAAMADQDIAEKLIPSVVCIQNYQVNQQYGFMYTANADSVSPAGEGSGIVFRADGYIVTNAHVIEGATSLKVILNDGSTHEATVVGSDTLTDLAVIKIDVSGLSPEQVVPADFGSSADMRVADKVMAIGNPGGYELSSSVTIGYVSALNRAITSDKTGYTMEFIQTDAAINPGNSGGALVNGHGPVVGINSAKISAAGFEGLGFAIPTDFARPIIADLIEFGYVKDRAMLGISGQFLDSMTGRFYGLPRGEYVGSLNTEHAYNSGLRAGDVIVAVDGTELTSDAVLRSLVNARKPGEVVTLTVYRPASGEMLEVRLTLSEYNGE